jgi:Fe(3+) dicitrate transport protein
MGTEHRVAVLLLCVCVPSLGFADDPLPSGPDTVAPSKFSSKVRADPADVLRRESGSSAVISEQEIQRAQPESSSELFRHVSGLQVRQEDQSGFRLNLGVRGLSPARSRLILVEEDGIPVVVSPYGEPELYYMTPVERVQSVDVVKGADVLRSGPQTVGAVVRLHTFSPTEKPTWLASLSLGERGYGEVIARYANTFNGVGVVAQVFHKWGDGYRNMPFSATDAFGKVRFATGSRGVLEIKIAYHQEDAHTTYTGLTDQMYHDDPRQDTIAPDDHFAINRFEIGLQHDHRFTAITKLHTAFFYYRMDTDLRLQDFDRFPYPQITYARDYDFLHFRNTASLRDRVYDVLGGTLELEQRFRTGPFKHKLTVGGRIMYDTARRKLSSGSFPTADSGALITDDETGILGLAGYLEDQIALSRILVVTPAFRVEHARSKKTTHRISDDFSGPRDVDITGNTTSTGWMPGVSATLGKPTVNAFTSLYRGYSAPRVSQAITPDGHDADLHAEISTNWEIGVRGRYARWLQAEADAFLINFDNQLVSNNPLSGATSEFVDGGRTQHIGAEGTARIRFGAAFRLPLEIDLAGHYTFVRSRFVGGSFDGHTVPYSPAHAVDLTLDLAHRWGMSAQVAFSYVGAQFTDESNTVEPGPTGLDGRIDPYTTLDLNTRYYNKRTGLSIALAVKNVLNRVYISDRLPNGIFTAGFRQIFATLAWSSRD